MTGPAPAPTLDGLCRQALDAIQTGLLLPPLALGEVLDDAERALAALRDRLIVRLRAEQPGSPNPRVRYTLDRVNVCISLVIGVEYPTAGVQKTALEQARDVLSDLLMAGLP